MIDCNNCKNNVLCKYKEQAQEIVSESEELKKKYKDFIGRITVNCDYFVTNTLVRSHNNG